MKPLLTALLLLYVAPSHSQADMQKICIALEQSNADYYHNVVSQNRQLLASFYTDKADEQLIFKLWDTRTGKLLNTKRVPNFGSGSYYSRLHFSPKNRLVYLVGYNHFESTEDKLMQFWNLATNELTLSACHTNKYTVASFSDDEKVAYVPTQEANKPCIAVTGPNDVTVSQAKAALTPKGTSKASKFLIPGGFKNDEQYLTSYGLHKYDQYLFFKHTSSLWKQVPRLFIFNWQTKQGQVVELPAELLDFRPHWLPAHKQFIIGLNRPDYTESIHSYNLNTKKLKTIHLVDEISHAETVLNDAGESEFHYRAFDKRAKQTYYCRLK